jgi:hypothetical protein
MYACSAVLNAYKKATPTTFKLLHHAEKKTIFILCFAFKSKCTAVIGALVPSRQIKEKVFYTSVIYSSSFK